MPRLPALLLLAPAMVYAACPNVHVFGARETTASPGYGTAGSVVNSIVAAYSGATAEAINYPACGGQSQCGGVAYGNSVAQGVAAVTSAVNGFNQQCPNTVLVLVGYSQGGQIFDDAYCGGGDPNDGISSSAIPLSSAAQAKIAAAIYMGDPRRVPGLAFNAGTCQSSGFAPRQSGFTCVHSANIQSYCDTNDQYCCSGNSAAIHQGYANEYGSTILAFVKNKVNAALAGGGGTTTTTGNGGGGTTTTSGGSQPTGGGGSGTCSALYGQCGGQGYSGPTCCSSGTCKASNQYYSQCL